jgi:glutamine synthetase
VLRHLPAIVALTAPSVISYARLAPHRWSAAFNNLGLRDREASLRICPTTAVDKAAVAEQYNLELRAADAAATPHIALAAIVHAGAQGIEEDLASPPVTEADISLLSESELEALGVTRLPASLEAALACFSDDPTAQAWFPGDFASVYRLHKLGEIDFLDGKNMGEICKLYEACY